MTGDEAAALLGVRPDADPALIRRAFRLWARSAHPDGGGTAADLDRLRRARDLLLRGRGSRAGRRPPEQPAAPVPPPRPGLGSVIARPAPMRIAALATVLATTLAAGALPAVGAGTPLPIAAAPAALLACALGLLLADSLARSAADAGHRVALLGLGWGVGAAGAMAVAQVAGRGLVEVLPLLAVPFVAAVSFLISPRPWSALPRMRG